MKWWNEIKESSSEERLIFCINGIRAGIAKLYKIEIYLKESIQI
jgi:hypothetical protein